MAFGSTSIKEAIRAATPAPYDETAGFKKFSLVFASLSIVLLPTLAYVIAFIIGENYELYLEPVQCYLPIISARLEFLGRHSIHSVSGYLATIICASVSLPIILFIHVLAYLKFVGISASDRVASWNTVFLVVLSNFAFFYLIWIAFIFTPSEFNPSRPGNAALYFWPFFPALGANTAFILESSIFATVITSIKIVKQRRI